MLFKANGAFLKEESRRDSVEVVGPKGAFRKGLGRKGEYSIELNPVLLCEACTTTICVFEL